MPGLRQFLKSIPAVEYGYGCYRLQRCRRSYGAEFERLLDAAPAGMSPLQVANSLGEFAWLVRHPLFPTGLLGRLFPERSADAPTASNGVGKPDGRELQRAFANFARGYQVEQALAREWQRAESISEAAEQRLTEYLNWYVTYALRTFAVHLEMNSNPGSSDTIRMQRVLGELEGEDGELLDIGCAFVPLAERYSRLRRWVGLDLSLPALAIGRIVHGIAPESMVCAYSEDLPFASASFDIVVSSEVLEHTPHPRQMIAEIARVLREGGKAILSVPQHIVDFQDGRQHEIGPTDSTHRFHFHSLQELQALFQEHGLPVERLQADPHYIFTLRRSMTGSSGLDGSPSGSQAPISHDDPEDSASIVAAPPDAPFPPFACPDCGERLGAVEGTLYCPACNTDFARHDRVPVLLPRRLRQARLDMHGAVSRGGEQPAATGMRRNSEPSS